MMHPLSRCAPSNRHRSL